MLFLELEKKTRGRPRKTNSKTMRIEIRMTEEEFARLDFYASEAKKSKTALIKDSLESMYNLMKFRI